MKRFLVKFVLLVTLLMGVAQTANAQSVFESFKSRYDADMKKRAEKYGVSNTGNEFTKNWEIYSRSGGPAMAEGGFPIGNLLKNGQWFWWMIVMILTALSAAQIWVKGAGPGGGGNIIPDYTKLGLKLIFLMTFAIVPQFFYASAMTMKNAFTLIATLMTDVNGKNNGVMEKMLNQSSTGGTQNARLGNAIAEGIQEGFNQWTVPLAGPGRAATMQTYNVLAKGLNEKMTVQGFGYNNPFSIAMFPQGEAPPNEEGKVKSYGPGDAFDGDYTNVSGKAANFQIPVVDRPEDKNDQYVYTSGNNWDDILRGDYPRMLQFIFCAGSSPVVKGVLAGAGAWDLGSDGFDQDIEERAGELAKAVAAGSIAPESAFMPHSTLHITMLRFIAATKVPAFAKPDQVSALLSNIKSMVAAQTSTFVRLTFVDQMKNHNSSSVRTYGGKFIGGNGVNAAMPTERKEDLSYIGKKIKWLADWVAAPVRWFVVFAAESLFDVLIELNLVVLWLAAPLWLFDKTESAFRGAMNTLFTTTLYSPTLAALLTFWDAMTGVYLSTIYPSGDGLAAIKSAAMTVMAPQIAVNIIIMNILGVIICAVLTPAVCKGFFKGGNAVGAVLGGLITSAAAGGTIALTAAVPAVGAAAGIVKAGASSAGAAGAAGGRAAGGAASSAASAISSGAGNVAGALEGREATQSAGLAAATASTSGDAQTSFENSLSKRNRRPARRQPNTSLARTAVSRASTNSGESEDSSQSTPSASQAAAAPAPQGANAPVGAEPPVISGPGAPAFTPTVAGDGNAAQRLAKNVGRGAFVAGKAASVGVGVFALKSVQATASVVPDLIMSGGNFGSYMQMRGKRDLFQAGKPAQGQAGSPPGNVRDLRAQQGQQDEGEEGDPWRGGGNAWNGRS